MYIVCWFILLKYNANYWNIIYTPTVDMNSSSLGHIYWTRLVFKGRIPSIVFVTRQGGPARHLPGPAHTRSRGGYFAGITLAAAVRGPPTSVRYRAGWSGFALARPRPYTGPRGNVASNLCPSLVQGPVCYHVFLTRTCRAYVWRGGLSGGQGQGMQEKAPAAGLWVGWVGE